MKLYYLFKILTIFMTKIFHLPISESQSLKIRGKFYLQLDSYESPSFWTNDNDNYCKGVWKYNHDCDIYAKIRVSYNGRTKDAETDWKETKYRGKRNFEKDDNNPLEFPLYVGETGTLSSVIEILDYDPNSPNDLLDRISLNFHRVLPWDWEVKRYHRKRTWRKSPSSTNPRAYFYTHRAKTTSSTLQYKYKVTCEQNYYGHLCRTFCISENRKDGHYTCDKTYGNHICMDGWRDPPHCRTPKIEHGLPNRGKLQFWPMSPKKLQFYLISSGFKTCVKADFVRCFVGANYTVEVGMSKATFETVAKVINLGEGFQDEEDDSYADPVTIDVPMNVTKFSRFSFVAEIFEKSSTGRFVRSNFASDICELIPNRTLEFESPFGFYKDALEISGKTIDEYPYIRYKLKCRPHYYDGLCSTVCNPKNDEDGHYRCGEFGNKICMTGWTGENCKRPLHD